MTVVGDLTVLLDADTRGLRRGLSGLRSSLGGLTGLLGAVGGAAGIGAIVSSGLDAADAIQKMGVRTGATSEFLSGLKNAASQSDVEFEAVGRSITRLNRSIGEAQAGTKAQEEAFAALGISMQDLEGLNVDERFRLVSDALSKVKDESTAARIGNDLFGRSFEQLRPLIAGGAAGLDEFQKQAEATGQVLSQDQVNSAAKANDALQQLQNTVSALGTTFAVDLAPQITAALNTLQENLPAIISVAGKALSFVGSAFELVGTAIGGAAATAGALLRGEVSGALTVQQAAGSDLLNMITGGDAETEADKQAPTQTGILKSIDQSLRNGVPAVAG